MGRRIETVVLPGRQVRNAALNRWAEANGVRITRRIRRNVSEPGTWSVTVEVEAR